MPLHPLTNFEIQKCYQNELRFNGVYSRNSLTKTKDEVYVINLDENEKQFFYSRKTVLSIICNKCGSKNEKIFEKEELIEILKFLGLINNVEQREKNITE